MTSAPPPSGATSAPPVTSPTTAPTPSRTPEETEEPTKAAGSLSHGDRGTEVKELQRWLRNAGFYFGPIHGRFDDDVEDSVQSFQFWFSVQGDPPGVYGPHTRKELDRERRGH